jgi:predicted glutamine amidotransferase
MCVALLVKPNTAVDIEKVRRGATANPDGSGYAFVRNGKVEIRRSLKWEDIEKSFLRDMENNSESVFLVHHRIKSHGEVCKENCHPFRMADGGALIHNGVIPIHGIPKDWSDTRHFA